MKRNPRKLAWTKVFRRAHGKEMTVDNTLAFAARRNIPLRYNRDHITTTLKAMNRISEIRTRRERAFYKMRMAGNKERQRALDRKIVAENEHLLPRERASERLVREATMAMTEELVNVSEIPQVKEMKKKMVKKKLVGGDTGMEIDG